ncbi:MAG: NTP transferase domain-containing protein, partial [Deltaproteobacteria bacterium]|nr:NTP transferase domain-containing protein [Deltaproteobacteria bacterium]
MPQPIESAMILAAGFGRRLRPLTDLRPKPLLPVLNEPILGHWIGKLRRAGARRLVVNSHHLARQMAQALRAAREAHPGLTILPSPEPVIMGTAGGLKNAAPLIFPDNPHQTAFFVINGDIHSDIDLTALAAAHLAQSPRPPVTLALIDRPAKATVSLDPSGAIIAFRAPGPVPGEATRLCGAGIMVMERWFLETLPCAFSDVIERLMPLIPQGRPPAGLYFPGAAWADIGDVQEYFALNRDLAAGRVLLADPARVLGGLSGFVLAERGAAVDPGALVEDSILLAGSRVAGGATVKNAIVAG